MNAMSLDVRILALSLDHARAGLDAARAQQPPGVANPAQPPPADATGAVLELSAAAQALMRSS